MASDIEEVLNELAATVSYLRESGKLMREAVNHLIETEERIEKNNRYMQIIIEHIEKAISAALKRGMAMVSEMKAYRVENGELTSEIVNEGDLIKDFRGDDWLFVSVIPDGRSYKIYARKPKDPRSHRILFASVFNLEIR